MRKRCLAQLSGLGTDIHQADVWYPKSQLAEYSAVQHNSPVSTILLQENSFKPATKRAFFCLATGPLVRTPRTPPPELQLSISVALRVTEPSRERSLLECCALELCHICVTEAAYTGFIWRYTQPICVILSQVCCARRAAHHTEFSASLGPILGCARRF
jgi:hypothetical protein